MSDQTVTIKMSLDDESKALLKAATAAFKAAAGKIPAADKPAGKADDDDGLDDDTGDTGDDDGLGDDEPKVTAADVTAALKALSTASSKANAVKLMAKVGGTDKLSALKPAKYQAVIDAAKVATKKAKAAAAAAKAAEDDDI